MLCRLFREQQSLVLRLHTVIRLCEQYSQYRTSQFTLEGGVLAEEHRPAVGAGTGGLDKVIATFFRSSLVTE